MWDAIHNRDIDQIAIIGYSQGGGAVYVLSDLISNNPVTSSVPLEFTAYIDAIKHDDVNLGNAEDRRPIDSGYHVNYRQASGKRYGFPPLLLQGVDTPDPSVNTNVTATTWGGGLDHLSIDQDPRVIGRIIDGFSGTPGTGENVHYGVTSLIVRYRVVRSVNASSSMRLAV